MPISDAVRTTSLFVARSNLIILQPVAEMFTKYDTINDLH